MKKRDWLEWVLRLGVAGEFLGHGVFALQGKEGWFKYFEPFGITDEQTMVTILLVVGVIDLLVVLSVLFKPMRFVLLWAAIWGLWTAVLRWPIGPDPIWDFFERWANWATPLALLLYYGWPKKMKEWLS